MNRAIAYVRCSTREQAEGHSLDAQRDAISREAAHRQWNVAYWTEDPAQSGGRVDRPGLTYALSMLRAGHADCLIVSKLDPLGRSLAGLVDILNRSDKEGWSLIVLDMQIDSSTHTGRLMLHLLGSVAQWERERISERTREGLAVARSQGKAPGKKRATPREVVQRVVRERMKGATYRTIAAGLNGDGIPTSTGKAWAAGTIHMVLSQEGVL